jgi:integrase
MTTPRKSSRRRGFGSVRQLPSGKFQARYPGPDGQTHQGHTTFDTKTAADVFLSTVRSDIERNTWLPPHVVKSGNKAAALTLDEYAAGWLTDRGLKPRTRAHYAELLDRHILPALGGHELTTLNPSQVRAWHARLTTGPTMKAHSYSLLKTILGTAVTDDLIVANPCRIRGAGQSKRVVKIEPATLAELETIAARMPSRYRAMVLLAAWCAMRFGELAALTRADVDVESGVVRVRGAVVRVGGEAVRSTPKSAAGVRDVRVPPHLMPMLVGHLSEHVEPTQGAPLFPAKSGGYLNPSALARVYYPAREAAGRPDLRFHDLRHTGAVLAAQTGATLAELMARLGHSTAGAAMRYQHASVDRDALIAERLSALVTGSGKA